MLKILHRAWPAPPKMSRSQYFKYRLRLLVIAVIWVLMFVTLLLFWDDFHFLLKGLFVVLGFMFIPDFSMLEQLFVSYERYLKDGLRW
jgi:hypothetical protein